MKEQEPKYPDGIGFTEQTAKYVVENPDLYSEEVIELAKEFQKEEALNQEK